MRRFHRCVQLWVVGSVAFGLFLQSATASDPGAKISERMQAFVAEHQISGAVTLVARRGEVVHLAAAGLADVEAQRLMQKDTMFAIASMTKPIAATAVLILADERKLSIDDPVAKHIPEFAGVTLKEGGRPKTTLTIRHLLTHTSGLGGSQQNAASLQETAAQLAKRPLDFEPGTKWQYSPGLSVAGRIVEIVSRQPFDTFLQQRIFEPLKMQDTTFFPTEKQQQRLAQIYEPGADKKSLKQAEHWLTKLGPKRTPNPSGGLFSTAADMARFYQMVLNGGELDGNRIVSKKAVAEMTQVQTGDLKTGFTAGNGWGLGWCVVRKPQGVTESVSPGTFGHGGAFGTQGWVDPERKMIFVLMIQRTNFGNSDGSDIRGTFQKLAVEAFASP